MITILEIIYLSFHSSSQGSKPKMISILYINSIYSNHFALADEPVRMLFICSRLIVNEIFWCYYLKLM